MFDKDSVKVKKDTLDSMNKVIKNSVSIQEMEPKIESTFKSMKDFSDDLSKTYKENISLNHELENLKFRSRRLEQQIGGLQETIDYLEEIIKAIIEFVRGLFRNYDLPKHEEREFNDRFHEQIKKSKDKDDFEL